MAGYKPLLRAHGHAQVVAAVMQCLGFASLIASKPCRERAPVLVIVVSSILSSHTKLASGRW
ncbi:MAG: hypothetical protein HY848_12775 [Betaproteobacteria bacterium]|nr:hypothetical protein [Betaproteobacteria bacterium]